jgi:ATP-dependent Clp protease ATP-binding subunit ClpA
MSGSFSGLEEIIKNRLNRQGIGFGADIKCKDEKFQYMKKLKAEDLIQFGFESEFIGRLPVITVFEQLEVQDLYNILRSPTSSIIIGKKRDFKAYGIDLQFEDEALRQIAENAFNEKTGARGLNRALERVLIKFEHALPSTNISHLVITKAMVDDPVGELQKLLQNPEDPNQEDLFNQLLVEEERELEKSLRKKEVEFQQRYGIKFSDRRIKIITKRIVEERLDLDSIVEELLAVYKEARDFEQSFTFRNNIKLSFNEEAIDCLVEKVWDEGVELNNYLKQSFQNYEHGLKLINEKTRKYEFSIPPNGIENPEEYLNDLIRETYR